MAAGQNTHKGGGNRTTNNKQPVGTQGEPQGGGRREVTCYSLVVSLETIKQPYGWLARCAVPTARLYSSVRRATVLNIMPDSQVRISTSGQEVIAGSRDYGTQCETTRQPITTKT